MLVAPVVSGATPASRAMLPDCTTPEYRSFGRTTLIPAIPSTPPDGLSAGSVAGKQGPAPAREDELKVTPGDGGYGGDCRFRSVRFMLLISASIRTSVVRTPFSTLASWESIADRRPTAASSARSAALRA